MLTPRLYTVMLLRPFLSLACFWLLITARSCTCVTKLFSCLVRTLSFFRGKKSGLSSDALYLLSLVAALAVFYCSKTTCWYFSGRVAVYLSNIDRLDTIFTFLCVVLCSTLHLHPPPFHLGSFPEGSLRPAVSAVVGLRHIPGTISSQEVRAGVWCPRVLLHRLLEPPFVAGIADTTHRPL